MRKLIVLMVVCLMVGCQPNGQTTDRHWQRIAESAQGTTVNFYTWSDDSKSLKWLDGEVRSALKDKHQISFTINRLDSSELVAKLQADKANEIALGDIDLLWLDEEHYAQLASDDLLYRNFARDIANYQKYIDIKDPEAAYIGATSMAGDLVPFNCQQLTFYYDRDIIYEPPETLEQFKALINEYPGRFTYPHPSDPLGGAFLRTVILNFAEDEAFVNAPLSDAELEALIKPGVDYLIEVAPKLYDKGDSYPATGAALDELFASGEVYTTMSFNYWQGEQATADLIYPVGTRPYIFSEVGVGPKYYLGIPFNAANKAGAMLAINEILSKDLQIAKLRSKDNYGLPPYSYSRIEGDVDSDVSKAIRKRTIVDIGELLQSRVHDIPQKYHEKIVRYWQSQLTNNHPDD